VKTIANANELAKKAKRDIVQYEKLSDGVYALNFKDQGSKMKYTKEQILSYLEGNNEEKLREASNYFFRVSGQYRRLVQYYSNILTFDFLVVPKMRDNSNYKSSKFENDYHSVMNYSDDAYIEETCRFITAIIILDGVFYGYERQLNGTISIQQLPPQYCRSKYKIDGAYAVEFNLRFFDMYKDNDLKIKLFTMFPEEFLELYLDYKEGKTKEWVQLDPKFSRCHKFNDNPKPLLSDVFTELINLKEYKELDKSQSKMELYKLIVQRLPVDKDDGSPLLELEEAKALHGNAKKMISQDGIDVITTPLEVTSVNLQDKGSSLRDNIERANNSIYQAAGTNESMFNGGKEGGNIGLTNSIKTDETMLFPLLDQYKRWYDNKYKTIARSRNYTFELLLPKISVFNRKEMFDLWKEGATLGYSKLMPLIAMGIKQTTFINLLAYENDYLKLSDKMVPLASSHTQNGVGGKPPSAEGDLSSGGIKARKLETNKNRNK